MGALRDAIENEMPMCQPDVGQLLDYGIRCAEAALGSLPCRCEFDYTVGKDSWGPSVKQQCDRCRLLDELSEGR